MNSRLLIIDDEESIRDTLEMLLTPEGYQIHLASHGQEGLEKAEELMPDLILLDVMMPGMDGYEVCSRLRANPKLAEVPIIMITALDDRDSRLRGLEVGADDFLSKPLDRMELRYRTRTITRLNRYRRLLTERSRFEWAIEQFDDGFLLLNEYETILYANSAARLYLNIFKDSELSELNFSQRIKQFYKLEPASAWENWPAPNLAQSPRYLVRPDNNQESSLWLQVNVLEFASENMKEQLVHLRDVSDQMRLQRQMWSFQMMVSHKLRTPLNALTVLPLLTEKNKMLFDEQAQSLLDIVQQAASRLQEQILEILQYVDASHLLKLDNLFNLSEFSDLVTVIKEELELHDQVTWFMDNRLAEKILPLSKQGLELVLRELLSNAKKFHPQQSPQIDISMKPINGDQISLIVADNGQHLPNEVIPKVWIPYYQHEKTFSGEIKGMGLGLSMIARLVWGSGGHCHLHNREDQPGIQVELILPLSTEALNPS